jgi:hypothetical protein
VSKGKFISNPQDVTETSVRACDDLREGNNGMVWRSSTGSGCEAYQKLKLCTPDGGAGEGWDSSFGSFADWATAGLDATQVMIPLE